MLSARVETVGLNPATGGIVLLLRADNGRMLPLVIGALEAQHLLVALSDERPPRPLTPDLLLSTLEYLGARLLRVEVVDLRENVFYARIVLEHRGIEHELDARPSDAVGLAARARAPILVAPAVLEAAGVDESSVSRGGVEGEIPQA